MDCTGECSGCFDVGNCEWFFNNFILPDIIEEQRKEEYLEEQKNQPYDGSCGCQEEYEYNFKGEE